MKKLPVNVSTFDIIMREGYVYVDKTMYIYHLMTTGRFFYFLSRPRRFGKSLLVSTLKELFSGNKELFDGLWIAKNTSYDWTPYPVIHLDFSKFAIADAHQLEKSLSWALEQIAYSYGIDITGAPYAGLKLDALVTHLSKKGRVVVLVDEYDYPIINAIAKPSLAEANRDILKNFFSALKSLDRYLHAIFITGVTKFSKTSIFSGLNNLEDISLSAKAASLLGYTHEELTQCFSSYAQVLAVQQAVSEATLFQELQTWYNGYRFSEDLATVYNPLSLLYYFKERKRVNYWFRSGTPSFLVELLKKQPLALSYLDKEVLGYQDLDSSYDIAHVPLVILLFQTGYLTIVDYNQATEHYRLDFPNQEVRLSMSSLMVSILAHIESIKITGIASRLKGALEENNIPEFCSVLSALLANIPYDLHVPRESYYHSLLHFAVLLLGIDVTSEEHTSKGRIDLVLTLPQHRFIFEFKLNKSVQEALEQIKQQRYYEKYAYDPKPLTLVGISFNHEEKHVECAWVMREAAA